MAADAVATAAAFLLAYYVGGRGLQRLGMWVVLPVRDYLWVLGVSIPLWWGLFGLTGNYDLMRLHSAGAVVAGLLKPMAVGGLVIGCLPFLTKQPFASRRVLVGFLAGDFGLIIVGRLGVLRLVERTSLCGHVLLVGGAAAAREMQDRLERGRWGLHVMGRLSWGGPDAGAAPAESRELPLLLGRADTIADALERHVVDDVIVLDAPDSLNRIQDLIRHCEEVGVRAHVQSAVFGPRFARPLVESLPDVSLVTFTPVPHALGPLALKRATDIALSGGLLLFGWPALLGLAALVRATSRGAAIFRQARRGLNGRAFTLYKFRSMREGAEAHQAEVAGLNVMRGPVFKAPVDPRITPLGRVLRRYSLDELPQLWNVLKGDMSLVGPRPPLPDEVKGYERWQRRRLSMRPGMTCLWQVAARENVDFEEWMRLDLDYIDNWSLWLDAQILLRTVFAVLYGTGR